MATLNVRNGSKVRLFVTPSRINRGQPCQEKTCAISLAAIEQLGLTDVETTYTGITGKLRNGRTVTLVPVNQRHHEKFILAFDASRKTSWRGEQPRPIRTNLTYEVYTK